MHSSTTKRRNAGLLAVAGLLWAGAAGAQEGKPPSDATDILKAGGIDYLIFRVDPEHVLKMPE